MFDLMSKSNEGNTSWQVFVSEKVCIAVYPMQSQEQFLTDLHQFCKKVGVPDNIVVDGHNAQTSNEEKQFCDHVGTTLNILKTGTSWENCAELYIGLLKEAVRKDLRASNSHMVLQDYDIQRSA